MKPITYQPRGFTFRLLVLFALQLPLTAPVAAQSLDKSATSAAVVLWTPPRVADHTAFLLTRRTTAPEANLQPTALDDTASVADAAFQVETHERMLKVSLHRRPIVDFVFRDEKILRPYFANARLPNGVQVTRTHPPVAGVDAVDHDTMHPGIWLGLGDVSGEDFWRNKASMEHMRFVATPETVDGQLRFATECRLKTSKGEPFCLLTNHFSLTTRPQGWLLVWTAVFHADQRALSFGDQEEMGFGARLATPFTEKNGGRIRSSTGKQSAKETWGQPAVWCDYSGSGPQSGGVLLMASPGNFRESWWHNRDYGVFVANPFGRNAMKQGPVSALPVARGETWRITFGAMVHDHRELDANAEYDAFKKLSSQESAPMH